MPDNTSPEPTPEAADLETFDLDGFIEGTVIPSKTIPVTNQRALGQQIQEQTEAIAQLLDKERTTRVEGRPGRRRLGSQGAPELDAARRTLAELEEQARGSYVFVKVEGTLDDDIKAQAMKDAKASLGDANRAHRLSVLAHTGRLHKVDPRTHPDSTGTLMSLEQWGAFATAIGFVQWQQVVLAMAEVNDVGVTPDFSQPASPSPETGGSSES